jgi:hypothetical protein
MTTTQAIGLLRFRAEAPPLFGTLHEDWRVRDAKDTDYVACPRELLRALVRALDPHDVLAPERMPDAE